MKYERNLIDPYPKPEKTARRTGFNRPLSETRKTEKEWDLIDLYPKSEKMARNAHSNAISLITSLIYELGRITTMGNTEGQLAYRAFAIVVTSM